MDELFTINTNTGAVTLVQAINFGATGASNVVSLAFDGTDLVTIDNANGFIVVVDTGGTAQSATALTSLPSGALLEGLAFNGTNFLASDTANDELLSITAAGVVSAVATAAPGFSAIQGLAPGTGVAFGVDTETDRLISINTTTEHGYRWEPILMEKQGMINQVLVYR